MKEKKEASAVGDASTFARFINGTGEISKALYLARHPEENDEDTRATAVRNGKVPESLGQLAA